MTQTKKKKSNSKNKKMLKTKAATTATPARTKGYRKSKHQGMLNNIYAK
jgi:hypothetical protein